MRYFYFLFFITFTVHSQNSPCDGNFNMITENNSVLCEGDSIFIFPNTTGLDSFAWFDGSHSIPRTFSQTGQYIFNGFITVEDLIINGDFENLTAGFSSDYTNNQLSIWNEGTYAITNDVSIQHPNLISFGHGGTGSFMAVNGTGVVNTEVWCEDITVIPNTNYEFSAWVTSTHPSNPATLQFRVNGTLLSTPFSAAAAVNTWNEFFAVWNSGTNTSVEICIVNQNTSLSGNDFGIDDISFFRQCDSTLLVDTFNLVVHPYADASIIDPDPVCISETSTQIMPNVPGGAWSGNGITNAGLGLFSAVNAGVGQHTLTYTFYDPCGDVETTIIEVFPDVELGLDTFVCEISPEFNISVASDTTGYWIGNGIDANGIFTPSSVTPGHHIISYTNTVCNDEMDIRVDAIPELILPELEVCEGLDPIVISLDSIYDTYLWNDSTTSVYKIIDKPGDYSLTIRNGACIKEFEFTVLNSCTPDVFFPTIFTPNGDGVNDSFFPVLTGVDESNMTLQVFDRWGKKLYNSSSADNPWFGDNLSGEKVAQGNYVYTFSYGYFVKGKYFTTIENGVINITF